MEKINIKIYLFTFFFLIFFFVLIIIFPINKKESRPNLNTPSPTPTTMKIFPTKTATTEFVSDNLLKPTSTGGGEEEPPKEELELAIKKQELQDKTPLIEESFMITFDYSTDKFIVSLQKPNDEAQKAFEQWREKNYPEIPLDRFSFQSD